MPRPEAHVGTLVSPIEGLKPVFQQQGSNGPLVGTLVSPIEGLKQLCYWTC